MDEKAPTTQCVLQVWAGFKKNGWDDPTGAKDAAESPGPVRFMTLRICDLRIIDSHVRLNTGICLSACSTFACPQKEVISFGYGLGPLVCTVSLRAK